jgi:hypothetical protein
MMKLTIKFHILLSLKINNKNDYIRINQEIT